MPAHDDATATSHEQWKGRFAAPLRLDPTQEIDRLLVEHFGDLLGKIPAARPCRRWGSKRSEPLRTRS